MKFFGAQKIATLPGTLRANNCNKIEVSVCGDSMLPTYKDGDTISFNKFTGQHLSVGLVVLCSHPYQRNKKIVKRITKIESDDLVYIRGDNPSFSTDSRSYGPISKSKIIALKTEK